MPKPKQIAILRSNPVYPDPRVEKLAETLVSAEYNVLILAWARSGQIPANRNTVPINYIYYEKKAAYGSGLRNLGKLLGWQVWLLRNQWKLRREISVIHACDFDTLLPALALKLLAGKRVIYDIFDFYADHIRNTPSWLKRLISALEQFLACFADKVFLPDEVRKAQLPRLPEEKIEIINNSPPDILKELETQEHENFTVAYVGIIQRERGLFMIADLLRAHPEWDFTIGGYGGDTEEFLEYIQDIPNIKWLGRLPYREALAAYASADLLMALYDPAVHNHRLASPNKLFEAMMLGKPVLAARNTHIDQIIEDHQLGLVIDYHNRTAIEQAIYHLASEQKLRALCQKNGRILYETQYSWPVMQKRILQSYRGVMQ